MRKLLTIGILTICCMLLLSGCAALTTENPPAEEAPPSVMVDVMLQETEGITITGANPIRVEAGSEAAFDVEIKDGYKIVALPKNTVYEDGKIIVRDVRYPTTLEVGTRLLYDLHNMYNQAV